ncbi:hypothetical protein [Oceanobacillus profundus]|nr:hypothetical protein [Oceanobacillus profundus]
MGEKEWIKDDEILIGEGIEILLADKKLDPNNGSSLNLRLMFG